jgi:hypothetical protein
MTYRGENYDVLDTALIPARRMDQHRRFLNNQYAFPAKPRNQWEIGVHFGQYNVFGDVPTLFFWQKGGYGVGAHIRKSLGYVFSARLDYTYGIAKGLDWQPSNNYGSNPAWNGTNWGGSTGYTGPVFYNYRMEAHQLNIDLIANFTNINFHKARTKLNLYGFLGGGLLAYGTRINSLDANYNRYDFASILAQYPNGINDRSQRKEVREKLQDLLDDSYETDAQADKSKRTSGIFKSKSLAGVFNVGVGAQLKLSKRFNISAENRYSMPIGASGDLLDGQRYSGNAGAISPSPSNDGINYFNIGFNYNLGKSGRSVEPLYWLNPLDHAYNELSNPRHMKLPDPILSDSDGDGIADQFDKCPGTPAGVAVDSHGCPMDTDGDGVPDDRDKQLITPTECQPVDAAGVGKCPCNCEGVVGACGSIGAGSLVFAGGTTKISSSMQSQLASLAAQMQANPTCKVVIIGNGAGSKVQQQRSWDRVNAVIEYMSEKSGIDRGRFIFQYGGQGDENVVTYRSANSGEEGPSNVAPPFPNLRRD